VRVLLTTSTFPLSPDDGTPRFVFDLAEALAAGCRVTVLAPAAPGAAAAERWGDVSVVRFAYFRPRAWQRLAYGDGIDTNLRRSWLARAQAAPFVLAQARAVRRLVAREAIDVVNSHWVVPQGVAAALARGPGRRFPHVVSLHGGDVHALARLPLGRRLAGFVAARSDAWLASSRAVRDRFDAVLGRPSQASLQPMGVHVARFRAAQPLPGAEVGLPDGYLLYVGRLQEIKGVSFLLRALPAVRARHPEVSLLVAGYGEREAALRREAEALGIAGAVVFAGRRPADWVARAMRGCAAVVVPSIRLPGGREEGMPTVVAEALAAGARVVATATGGIPDRVRHGENGWLCRDSDPDALAAAILAALAAAWPPEDGVAAAAQALDWSRVAECYLEVYRAVSGA
jgi:glycosyltransferase involved in cell wall biosynthesis